MTYGIKDVAVDVIRGNAIAASPSVQKERIKICESCPHMNMIRQCKICLCFVDSKTRTRKSSCPIDKWLAEPDTT